MLGAFIIAPDFPSIFEAINSTLAGDASAFVSPALTLGGVVAMPLLCNDYSMYHLGPCYNENADGKLDYPRTFEYFQKSLEDGLKVLHSHSPRQINVLII